MDEREPPPTRRQAPSPLVFATDNKNSPPLPPANPPPSTAATTPNPSNVAPHALQQAVSQSSNSNQVSMPFIKRHVTRRLRLAKDECDKELQKVTDMITAFFEERIRDAEPVDLPDQPRAPAAVRPGELRRAVRELEDNEQQHAVVDHSDGETGDEADIDSNRLSTARSHPSLSRRSTSPEVSIPSVSSSPGALRRYPGSGSRHVEQISPRKASNSSTAPSTTGSASSSLPAPGAAASSTAAGRRLSRAIRVPVFPPSEASSRSTSRSRSPLPSSRNENSPRTSNRRSSRIWLDEPLDPFMTALHGITAIATEIQDMSLSALSAEPGACNELVNRIQVLGKGWDEHPEWLGRGWYVQALLSVAKLARVVEWWQAEKQFWNFEDDDEESSEPLAFVLKPEAAGPQPEEETVSGRRRPSRPSLFGHRRNTHHKTTTDLSTRRQPAQIQDVETNRVQATERLREKAEEAQRLNIVVELSLDGDQLIWINHAWSDVIGTDPEESTGTSVSSLLAPDDIHVFRDATDKLQEDDTHTIEVRFRMQVDVSRYHGGGPLVYREMEAKGMLMLDRGDGTPSHTMWVIKPIGPPEPAQSFALEMGDIGYEPSAAFSSLLGMRRDTVTSLEPVTPFPFNRPISTASIMCRICECQVPEWYFEKHNETCSEVHKLEADISECNDSISELRTKMRELSAALENPVAGSTPEYRGMAIYCGTPGTSSPLQVFRPALPRQFQKPNLRKSHQKVIEALDEVLQLALEVSMPALRDDQAEEHIDTQRLLSPASERRVTQLRSWPRPATEDAALSRLVLDVDLLVRTKLENVTRMQNTIRYTEKVRQEWEEKVEQTLAQLEATEDDDEDDGEEGEDTTEEGVGHHLATGEAAEGGYSSTTSEYEFGRDEPSSDPTPTQCVSPPPGGHKSTHSSGGVTPSVPIPQVPATYAGVGSRSSTPSSVSSPLARAVPIVASAQDLAAAAKAVMTDSQTSTIATTSSATLHRQVSSVSNIEASKATFTPPLSPMLSPKEGASLNRRHSTALHAVTSPTPSTGGPLSPRIPSLAPRTTPSSIKDFEIIKPISKGAFGSVFLAKKKTTGDYYAIKVLKKADMIAKNQITNVKAERMILMRQAESPFVVKLFFTFQSKENLYLVMEYLNGGDCAALIKSLGALPEEWTKNYVAEVVLGLEYLHERGVVHRDLKPDNLLIDQYGHLKLTDFGLSRIGLLGRQTRDTAIPSLIRGRGPSSRPPSIDSAYLSSPILFSELNTPSTGYFAHRGHSAPRMHEDESSGSESLGGLRTSRHASKPSESPLQSFALDLSTELRSHSMSSATSGGTPPGEQKFVGTPDYLAPETILGFSGDDHTVDWWAMGVITYEFLYGIPPFHAETPEKVFDNIISRRIEWHEDLIDYSPEARDFMERLLVTDPARRLGANGATEVKAHPWFADIEWDKVMQSKAQFIPQVTDPESTDYFDPRGASSLLLQDDEPAALHNRPPIDSPGSEELMQSTTVPLPMLPASGPPSSNDDFGAFSFKNLPVLKHANDEVIRKLRSDNMVPLAQSLSEPPMIHSRRKSLSQRIKKPSNLVTDVKVGTNPPSPSTSTSSITSSPSRGSIPAPLSAAGSGSHSRRPSEYGAVERFKLNQMELDRRNSMPSRLRTASVSSSDPGTTSDLWTHVGSSPVVLESTPPSSVTSKKSDSSDRVVTCLLAEDNPISMKIMETLLTRMGCRCVLVTDGAEAISVALGEIKFDCILMDYQMPVVDGETAARYIKSTHNKNQNTPIIAVSAYSGQNSHAGGSLFAASLAKPLNKADLLSAMRSLGFKISTQDSKPNAAKLITR
ncbi:hypothetical protein EXIGLDRAFT_600010 [Exidia glandulosa HHB12029]|uniref:non-specific serine/threonine protein kinase n=1 Tax=Exidia glandulosa HHB12029 TaxID=1314781 RepID=A0A166BUD8_EXIGL|nr:hypothetical protein EXIGLDRAFT_600010 [Exidia glandulosa HHB12029]